MNKEILKVSDWSQKYKLIIYAISGAGITYFCLKIYGVLLEIKDLLSTLTIK